MSRILIIEDEEAIADLEKDYLELSGFEVEIENRGDTGLVRAMKEEFDLIILDLMLPEVDGFDICRQVREEKNTPIIMVSAKKDDIDKIRGLGLGADDYMTKPFSPSELVARVKAHMERYNRLVGSNVHKNDVIEIRGIKIDKTARRVWVNGEETTFGEYGKSYCGNCLNCQTEFEEQDVSQEARAMIRCVESSGQRYGVNVILDTLRGASTAKIRQYEMDGNPEYGVCAKIPAHRLRQIFNYLVLKEYLHLTDDGYTIVKLTAASRSFLEEEHILTMKMSKELETKKKEKRSRLPKSAVGELGEQDEPLFQKLRALRLEIAREEKIPPYMVFSDKTLIHMCILKPGNEEEMLNVTGVGRHKYEKYGKRFIDAVKNL